MCRPEEDRAPREVPTRPNLLLCIYADPANRRIVDLANAVNLSHGEVAFSADFFAVRPKDPHKSNGSLLLEVRNRGKSRIISLVDGGNWAIQQDAGDGWLLRNDYTIASP